MKYLLLILVVLGILVLLPQGLNSLDMVVNMYENWRNN